VRFESIEMGRPEPAIGRQPVIELGERLGPNAIEAALPVGTRLDEPCLMKNSKMLRHRRLAELEMLHERPDRSFAIS
jgi:hypothetical protein